METTLGQLIADLYDAFEECVHDPELATLATAAVVNDLLCDVAQRDAGARTRPHAREIREITVHATM